MQKEQFFSLEMEIERSLSMIEVKKWGRNIPQDRHMLAPVDLVGGEPSSSLAKKVDAAHVKEVTELSE